MKIKRNNNFSETIKKFFAQRWVQGLFAFLLVILAIFTFFFRPAPSEDSKPVIKEPEISAQPVSPELPQEKDITNIDIDNTNLTELYNEAHTYVLEKYHDAKLCKLDIFIRPYSKYLPLTIWFTFHSTWADKQITYGAFQNASGAMEMTEFKTPYIVQYAWERNTFSELPWIKYPSWPQFIKMSYEKIGPISAVEETGYHIIAYANYYIDDAPWAVVFMDGLTGENFTFVWFGEGYPVQK